MNMDIEDILGDIKASNGKTDKPAKAAPAKAVKAVVKAAPAKAEKPAKAAAKPAAKKAAPAKKVAAKPVAKKAAPAKAVKAVAKPVAKKAPAKAVKAVAKPVTKKAPAKTATSRPSEFIVFAEGERAELAKQIKKIVRKEMNSRVLAERLGIHSRKLRRVLYGMDKAGTIKVVPGPSRKLGMFVQPV